MGCLECTFAQALLCNPTVECKLARIHGMGNVLSHARTPREMEGVFGLCGQGRKGPRARINSLALVTCRQRFWCLGSRFLRDIVEEEHVTQNTVLVLQQLADYGCLFVDTPARFIATN